MGDRVDSLDDQGGTRHGEPLVGHDVDRLRGRAIFHTGPDIVVDVDTNGTIRGWNPMAENVLGYGARDALGRSASLLLPDRSDPEARAALVELSGSPQAASLLVDYRRPDGEVRHVSYHAIPLLETDGEVVGTTVIGRDLSALHQSQTALVARETSYRTMVAGAHEGIGAIDAQGRVRFSNARLATMLGYPVDELVGLGIDALIFPEDAPTVAAITARGLRGETEEGEIRLRRKDGSVLWTIVATAPFPDEVGVIGAVAGFFTDITDRIRAAAALQESEARVRAYFEYVSVGMVIARLDGTIERVNPALSAITGYDTHELLGRPLSLFVSPDATTRIEALVEDLRAGDRPSFEMEHLFVPKEGHPVWLNVMVSLMRDEQGTPIELVAVIKDVSERKEAERVKDEFVSVTSHELRTPLTSIRGALGLLTGGIVGDLPASAQRMLDIAVRSTDRLIRLINDILDLERLTSGKLSLTFEACEVAGLISRAVEEIRGAADAVAVEIRAGSVDGRVWADLDRVIQTLTNLIGNAIKFSPPFGAVEVSAQVEEGHICFAVEDHGPGIPAHQLEAVFERFQQVDASDSRAKGGTGLGLAICRSIVEQHGGRIWAESVFGEGATFRFTLPLVEDVGEGERDDAGSAPGVLVCDDDAAMRERVKATLEASGYRVWTAARGEEALVVAQARHPDVIVFDRLLPGIDGRETAIALTGQEGTVHIPVVVLSVLRAEQEPVEGAAAYEDTPGEDDALLAALRRALGGTRRQALVVEDDPQLAEVLEVTLARHGLKVRRARSGREAMRLSRAVAPDLLVLDLALPGGDGFRVVEWMRAQRWRSTVPVLVYTAFDLTDADRNRLRLGETRFLTKGRTSPELFEANLEELLAWVAHEASRR